MKKLDKRQQPRLKVYIVFRNAVDIGGDASIEGVYGSRRAANMGALRTCRRWGIERTYVYVLRHVVRSDIRTLLEESGLCAKRVLKTSRK